MCRTLCASGMSFRSVLLACCCCLTAPEFGVAVLADDVPLSRISFGSCAKQDQPQPIWEAIVAGHPELFVFLGDNIYGDSPDMDVLRSKYALLNQQPGFQKLKQVCPVVATWDDHDYGKDDSGAFQSARIGDVGEFSKGARTPVSSAS